MTYIVYMKDNSEAEATGRKVDEGEDREAALATCKRIVDRSLDEFGTSKSAVEIFRQYTMWGEDAWIITADPDCKFSAWDYAKERCQEIAAKRT